MDAPGSRRAARGRRPHRRRARRRPVGRAASSRTTSPAGCASGMIAVRTPVAGRPTVFSGTVPATVECPSGGIPGEPSAAAPPPPPAPHDPEPPTQPGGPEPVEPGGGYRLAVFCAASDPGRCEGSAARRGVTSCRPAALRAARAACARATSRARVARRVARAGTRRRPPLPQGRAALPRDLRPRGRRRDRVPLHAHGRARDVRHRRLDVRRLGTLRPPRASRRTPGRSRRRARPHRRPAPTPRTCRASRRAGSPW